MSTWISFALGAFGTGGLSALGGYLLSGRNERKRDERAAERERETLVEQQANQGRSFQRDTLLELHDTLYRLNRISGRAQHADEMTYRETGRYGRDQLPDGLSDDFSQLIGDINRLRVRIFDENLRDLVASYIQALIECSLARGPRQAGDDATERGRVEAAWEKATLQYPTLEETLGTTIRNQFPSYYHELVRRDGIVGDQSLSRPSSSGASSRR